MHLLTIIKSGIQQKKQWDWRVLFEENYVIKGLQFVTEDADFSYSNDAAIGYGRDKRYLYAISLWWRNIS